MRRPLTHAETMEACRIDAELNGHSPSQTIGFVNALADVDDALTRLPAGVISPDLEPRWLTTVRGWLGR